MQMPRDVGPFHIIGIGGIGMSAIAEILVAKGYSVQGSDQRENANVRRLRAKGIRVFVGHDPVNLIGARYVVVSSAVKALNAELVAARQKGLTIIRRAEMLAELMRLYSTISVTGTHGKTTTTSLLSHVFTEAGEDPTVITGGIINAWGSNARLGLGKWMIVEADESDGTFTRLPTEFGIITNIDPEHLDHFGSIEAMHHEYEVFLKNIPFFGLSVVCIDHPIVRDMVQRLGLRADGRRLLTYGQSKDADIVLQSIRIEGSTTYFDASLTARVKGGARQLEDWSVPIPGVHNALNALAAMAVASDAGIDDAKIKAAMADFSGVKRRFQLTGEWNGVAIYDDYAHHPTEISAVLAAARGGAQGKVFAVVEPHRYTRVRDLFDEFATCFKDADHVIVTPLYTAGENPIAGVDHLTFADRVRTKGHRSAQAIEAPGDLVAALRLAAQPGDVVVCLGAGNSTEWANALPGWLKEAPKRAGSAA